jgi:hypothetical protein
MYRDKTRRKRPSSGGGRTPMDEPHARQASGSLSDVELQRSATGIL